MKRPPRNPQEPLFDKKLWLPSLVKGISVLTALILIYLIALWRGQEEADVRALVFTTLLISNVALIYTSRQGTKSLKELFIAKENKVVHWIAFGSLALLTFVLSNDQLREILHFSKLHFNDLLISLGVGIGTIILPEAGIPFGTRRRLFDNR